MNWHMVLTLISAVECLQRGLATDLPADADSKNYWNLKWASSMVSSIPHARIGFTLSAGILSFSTPVVTYLLISLLHAYSIHWTFLRPSIRILALAIFSVGRADMLQLNYLEIECPQRRSRILCPTKVSQIFWSRQQPRFSTRLACAQKDARRHTNHMSHRWGRV
jgi:hypothetical protein